MILLVLLLAGFISFTFFVRFLRLGRGYFEDIERMNGIKRFYLDQFKHIPNVEKIMCEYQEPERQRTAPLYIRYTVIFLGSLCFSGSAYVKFLFFEK